MNFTISPMKGVGKVLFGMSRDDVRRIVGAKFQSFKRSAEDPSPCDYFEGEGAFFYYNPADRLDAVEFALPAQPSVAGVALLGLGFDDACGRLRALGGEVEKEADGAIAHNLGVSIYAPLGKADPAAPIESVVAFRAGYYG